MNFKPKILNSNYKVLMTLFQVPLDLVIHLPNCNQNRNALTKEEYINYKELIDTKIFWKPEN